MQDPVLRNALTLRKLKEGGLEAVLTLPRR
jgi:hypothetical protein